MSVAPTQQIYQYREVDSLDEVNRLAAEESFDLFQAVALEGRLRFVVRRVRDSEMGRRVGFAGPPQGPPAGSPSTTPARWRRRKIDYSFCSLI